MNCLEFRREKLADPRRLPDVARAHAAECATCSAFERDFDRAELRLERALETPVPEALAERILSRIGMPRRPWRGWALAASVLASLGGGFLLGVWAETENAYARLAIEHVAMEPESLDSPDPADPRDFQAAVREFGGTVRWLPGKVVYFTRCPVEGETGWHAVFETGQGLATLIFVPGKRPKRPESAATAEWSALAEPIRGGYYVIVTQTPAATAAFEETLRSAVAWDA